MVKFTLRHSDKFVGLFILAGTLALVAALAYVGVNKRWFKRDLEFRSYFATAEGLSPGLDLELRGFAIGRVESVTLLDNPRESNQVELTLTIFAEHAERVVEGSVVCLSVSPMGFGSKLILYPGLDGDEALPAGWVIPSSDTPLGQTLLAEGRVDRPQRRDEVTRMLGALPPLLAKADAFIVTMDSLMSHMDGHLTGGSGLPGQGLLGSVNSTLLATGATVAEFSFLAARLDSLTRRLDGSLLAVNGLLNASEGVVPAMLGREGSAAMLFRDDAQLYENMLQIMNELRVMMNFLNESTPEISALMEESTSALVESEKLMQGLQNNPLLRGGIAPAGGNAALFEGHRQEVR